MGASSKPNIPVSVRVQRSQSYLGQASGFMLPEGESPDSLANFVGKHARRLKFQLDTVKNSKEGEGPQVYVSIASSNRLDELLVDRAQLQEAGQVDGFLFIWITSAKECRDGHVAEDHRSYIHQKLGRKVPVGFICWWDSFLNTDFTRRSILDLDT